MVIIPEQYSNGAKTLEYECPWLVPGSVKYLDEILKSSYRVLEFGSGGSTLFFSRRCLSVLTFETDNEWYEKTKNELIKKNISNCTLILNNNEDEIAEKLKNEKVFDVVLIDCDRSISRKRRMELSMPYITKQSLIILDNYDTQPCAGAMCGTYIDLMLPEWKTMVFDDSNWVGKGTKIFYN